MKTNANMYPLWKVKVEVPATNYGNKKLEYKYIVVNR